MVSRTSAIFGRTSGLHGLADDALKHLVSWGEHLKVDQSQIDAQHEAIFNIAVDIVDLWRKNGDIGELRALVDKFGKVLEAHFRYEEGVLAGIHYPRLAEHQAEHQAMLHELEVLRARLAGMADHGPAYPGPGFLVLNYMLGVTVGHIFHSDMDYCVFARQAAADDGRVWPVS